MAYCLLLHSAVEEVNRRNVQSMMSMLPINPDNPVLVMVVKRENIVDNTLNQIMRCGPCDLKKPLKVQILLTNFYSFPIVHHGRI